MGEMEHLKSPPYFNGTILAPDGKVLCRAGKDRIRWYLSRGIAEEVKADTPTIRLLFKPGGPGEGGDAYMLSERPNFCVVCGSSDNLTKHHIVPHHYRRGFPEEVKAHASYDILPLCVPCHKKYEGFAISFCDVAEKFGAPCEQWKTETDKAVCGVAHAAWALLEHGDKIPEDRKVELNKRVATYYGKDKASDEDIDAAQHLTWQRLVPKGLHILSTEELDVFVRMWRGHFLEKMQPKFMPKGWTVDRDAYGKEKDPDGTARGS